jgi:Domain of unknown function (DUF4169)
VTVGEVVNLNRVRKRVAREQAKKAADANRIKFGRSKAERSIDEATMRRQDTVLEQHRIDREDET